MINLNSMSFDRTQWEMLDTVHYQIRNLKTGKVYSLYNEYVSCHPELMLYKKFITMVGIYQISYNEFLVHCVRLNSLHYIGKLCLEDDTVIIPFSIQDFRKFDILSDKTILFNNCFVFDIEQDKKVEEFNWLCNQDLIVLQKDNYENPIIQVKFPISATHYISAYVDAISFKIIENKVFSTLRKKSILLDKQTIQDVIQEDSDQLLKLSANITFALESFEQEIFR